MKITRIYTDNEGETHFDEIEEPHIEFRSNAEYTRTINAYGVMFRITEPLGGDSDAAERGQRGAHSAPEVFDRDPRAVFVLHRHAHVGDHECDAAKHLS